MKSKFPGYFKPTKKEIKSLWDNAIFTLDANVLLNLYRYSDDTKEELLKIFEKIKDRVWIPNQAAKEFFKNKLNVINQQEKAYDASIQSLNTIETEFKNSRQHPFINSKLLKKFSLLAKDICEELTNNKKSHSNRILEDEILNRINILFEGKVGDEFPNEKIEELIKIGEDRFEDKIPPGFKDTSKNGNNGIGKFGDFFVWRQILDFSAEEKKSIILVTDDRKEDWWTRFKGKTLQPRPELIREFKDETGNNFHMYQSDRFLEFAREYLNEDINQEAINEIRELRKLDERRIIRQLKQEEEVMKIRHLQKRLMKEQLVFEDRLKLLSDKEQITQLRLIEELNKLENSDPSAYDDSRLSNLQEELKIYKLEKSELKNRLELLRHREMFERKRRNKILHNNS